MKGVASICLALFVSLGAVAGENGQRVGTFIFDTRYVVNAGCYLTNDTCHIELVKTSVLIPDSTEVLIYHRLITETNAEDWVQFTPVLTIADFPHDYYLESAISNDVSVTANYIPPSPETTNLLFQTSMKLWFGVISVSDLPLVVPGAHLELGVPQVEEESEPREFRINPKKKED